MKYSLLILLVLSIFSCNIQEKEIDINGNWYVLPNKGLDDFIYKEFYISDNVISVYQDIYGFNIEYSYIQENNVLYFTNSGEKIKHSIIKTIDENTFSIESIDSSIGIYKRIIGDGVNFEDLLNTDPYKEGKYKVKLESDFIEAFNKRKEINTFQK